MNDKIIKEEMKFSYTQLSAFEDYLSLKEKDGLRFTQIEGGKMFFEKATQREVKYSAVIFTGFSMREEFVEACEEQGWEFVSSYCDELYIFRTQMPEAQKIITDEKEYFKTVAKKAFLQPGFLKISLWTLFLLLTTVIFRSPYEGLVATSIEDCGIAVFIAFGLLQTAARLIHFASWYIKNKRELNENAGIYFDGAEKIEKLSRNWDIANVVQLLIMLATVVVLGAGYCDITIYCWICAAFIIVSVFDVVKNIVGKENKKRFYATFGVVCAVVIVSVFGVAQWASAQYNKNLSSTLNYNEVPISASDFVEGKFDSNDKILTVKATRLGQHYIFSSDYEDKNENYSFDYEVLVSDNDWVTEDYIDLLHKRYNKYESKLIKAENTYGWDEVYYEVSEGKEMRLGYALKGNTVVMLDYIDMSEDINFFETAYTKLN